MKRRICVRSMGLGAVIMLIGLAVGAIVSPPLIAQRNGVFGEVVCRRLTVVDKHGRTAIDLESTEKANSILLVDKADNLAVSLSAFRAHGKFPASHGITVCDQAGKNGVALSSASGINSVHVYREDKLGVVLHAEPLIGNAVSIYDQAGNIKWNAP